jgi:protoheme IX farnesyltransferase
MSVTTQNSASFASPSIVGGATPGDYFALLKPRVMSLVVWTALAGLLCAPTPVNPVVGFAALLAIAVGAGAAGALNMWWDADIDALMARTRLRPVPDGRIEAGAARAFGLTLTLLSVVTLAVTTNFLAAGLLAFTVFFYVVIYTMWLKRLTPLNIVIGGAAGALPPVVGYAAASGSVGIGILSLFAVIFFWTPPHFWALALVKSGDYARAGVPMLPTVKGAARTRTEILVYSLILAPLGLTPWLTGLGGLFYAVAATIAGVGMVVMALRLYRIREGAGANRAAMQMFGFSIVYLFTLVAVLIAERGLAAIAHRIW